VSQDRVEFVRAMFRLWNAGDRDFALLPEYMDPAIELESPFHSAGVFDFAGEDRLACLRVYRDVDEGLKAVGLEQ
jgi:hypothetical protein